MDLSPTKAASSCCALIIVLTASCATLIPSIKSCSEHSLASPSTMQRLSIVAPTIKSTVASFNCERVGCTTQSAPTLATCTSDNISVIGISDTAMAAEAANAAKAFGMVSLSAEIKLMMICVSFWYPSGKKGRSARSTRRQVKISSSLKRASLLKKLPGIRPAAANFS